LSDGRLRNAGVLLFGKRPHRLFPRAQVRIGLFRGTQILGSHDYQGTLWEQLEGAMQRFRQVLKARYEIKVEEATLEGLQRKEVWEYPLDALREAVVNALVHRDDTHPADIQIRLEEDGLQVWSPGELPPPLKPEDLRGPHCSVPRNPLLAQAFHFAGLIKRWGTGTTRIIELSRSHGLPEPEFQNQQGGFLVMFAKSPLHAGASPGNGAERTADQSGAVCEGAGCIADKEYQQLTGVSKRTASGELSELTGKGIFTKIGCQHGRGTVYRAPIGHIGQ